MHQTMRTEDHFRALVELGLDAMVTANRERRIQLVNRQPEALFGYPRRDLLGQPIEHLIPDCLRAARQQHRADGVAKPVNTEQLLSPLRM
jgi:PAS domain S-box-containing protein